MTAHGKFGLKIGCRKNAGMTGLMLTRAVMDVRKGEEMNNDNVTEKPTALTIDTVYDAG